MYKFQLVIMHEQFQLPGNTIDINENIYNDRCEI